MIPVNVQVYTETGVWPVRGTAVTAGAENANACDRKGQKTKRLDQGSVASVKMAKQNEEVSICLCTEGG